MCLGSVVSCALPVVRMRVDFGLENLSIRGENLDAFNYFNSVFRSSI